MMMIYENRSERVDRKEEEAVEEEESSCMWLL